MQRIEFLHLAFQQKRYRSSAWIIRILSEFHEPAGKPLPTEDFTPIRDGRGLYFINLEGQPERIDDYVPNSGPLFGLLDEADIDRSWLPNVVGTVRTDVGRLLANALMITEPFGMKIPYINAEMSVGTIEKIVASRLEDDPREYVAAKLARRKFTPPTPDWTGDIDTGPIYVYEMLDMGRGLEILTSVMELFSYAMTRKNILPPPGIKEFKEQLIAEYGEENLNDPVILSDFEDRLKKFDAAYLKGDPAFGKFVTGKILNDSRKKLHLAMGAEGGFAKGGKITAITSSLYEGIPRDPAKITAVFNGARAGSFSRGAETVEGGVAAKKMLAAANNYVIVDTDCGSKLGLGRIWSKSIVNSIRGRTVIEGANQVKVPVEADVTVYTGQWAIVRSPAYCKLEGENICKVCAGEALGRYATGVALPLTEISAAILAARMKAMHTNALKVNDFDIDTVFT